jgi:hypothetical protein
LFVHPLEINKIIAKQIKSKKNHKINTDAYLKASISNAIETNGSVSKYDKKIVKEIHINVLSLFTTDD